MNQGRLSSTTVYVQNGYCYTRVQSLAHLQMLAKGGDGEHIAEFILVLSFGFRRSKLIQYAFARNGRHWYVDDMDGESGVYYTLRQLHQHTMIPRGIEAGCLYLEERVVNHAVVGCGR